MYINKSIHVIIIQSCTFNKPLHFQSLFNYSTNTFLDTAHLSCFISHDGTNVSSSLGLSTGWRTTGNIHCVETKSISGNLESLFGDVEISLLALEDTIDARELQERQLDQRFQLAMYQERRKAEFNELSSKCILECSKLLRKLINGPYRFDW